MKKTVSILLVTCIMIIVNPLHIMLPKAIPNVKKDVCKCKWMNFLIGNEDLLEKYNIIWDKVIPDVKKESDSGSVYNKKFLKTKIKFHGDEVTDLYVKEVSKMDSNHTCLAVISLDYAPKKDENYYPQEFLKEKKK